MYRVLLEKPEGRRPLTRPRGRWVDIRMDLQEVGCGYMDWIGLAQDRDRWRTLVSAEMNFRVPWNAGNFLTNCKPVSFSRRTLHNGVSNRQKCIYGFIQYELLLSSLHQNLLVITLTLIISSWAELPQLGYRAVLHGRCRIVALGNSHLVTQL